MVKLPISIILGSATAAIPLMDSVSHFWGGIKVNAPNYVTGYSYPFLFKQSGVTKLLVGTEKGYLRMFDNIDGNLTGSFTMSDSTYLGIYEGGRSAPNRADINNDGYVDLVVGNYAGGVAFYKGTSSLIMDVGVSTQQPVPDVVLFPNPANHNLTVQIKNADGGNYNLELYSIVGQLIVSEKMNGTKYSLSTESLAQGVYICKVTENKAGNGRKNVMVKRLVIQH